MSQIQPQPIASDLFMSFPSMSDEKQQIPDGNSPSNNHASLDATTPIWSAMRSPNFFMPKFTPSDWLNSSTPSSLNFSFDYFSQLNGMQLPQHGDGQGHGQQRPQQPQQQVQTSSGGLFSPDLWLFQDTTPLARGPNIAGAGGSGSGTSNGSIHEHSLSSSSVSTSNDAADIDITMGAPLGPVVSGNSNGSAGPSRYNENSGSQTAFDRPNAIPTSLLTSANGSAESLESKFNVDSPDSYEDPTLSLSRVHSIQSQAGAAGQGFHRRSQSINQGQSGSAFGHHQTGHHSHSHLNPQYGYHPYADKRRASSFDSMDSGLNEPDLVDLADVDHEDGEHESGHDNDGVYEIHEGIERDGMIWGMKVEEYRALSARERKRVRNRISARTFRAKRKEHLTSLETDLYSKDHKIRTAQDEAHRLRKEVADLKIRLAKYEVV